jgi:hypothetical protein
MTSTRPVFATMAAAWLAAVAGAVSATPDQISQTPAMPEPTAAAVWGHLQQADYRANWRVWPGTSAYQRGRAPHGALLTTYVNAVGHDAVTNRSAVMPAGAMVVKENFTADRQLAAVTVMYKASKGYDPEHNDWFWLKRLADGTVEASGRVGACQGCHQSGTDYIRTPGLGGGG